MLLFWVYYVVLPRSWCSLVLFCCLLWILSISSTFSNLLSLFPTEVLPKFSVNSCFFLISFLIALQPSRIVGFTRLSKKLISFYLLFFLILSPLSFLDLGARSSCSVWELWQPDADVPEDSPLFPFLSRVYFLFCRIIIASCASSALHRRLRCRPFSKLASVVSCRFSSLSVLSPTAHARARGTVETLFLKCV